MVGNGGGKYGGWKSADVGVILVAAAVDDANGEPDAVPPAPMAPIPPWVAPAETLS